MFLIRLALFQKFLFDYLLRCWYTDISHFSFGIYVKKNILWQKLVFWINVEEFLKGFNSINRKKIVKQRMIRNCCRIRTPDLNKTLPNRPKPINIKSLSLSLSPHSLSIYIYMPNRTLWFCSTCYSRQLNHSLFLSLSKMIIHYFIKSYVPIGHNWPTNVPFLPLSHEV